MCFSAWTSLGSLHLRFHTTTMSTRINIQQKGKHTAVIPMGENEEGGKTSFCGCGGRADLIEGLMRWSLKEEAWLVILWHLIEVGVYWYEWIHAYLLLSLPAFCKLYIVFMKGLTTRSNMTCDPGPWHDESGFNYMVYFSIFFLPNVISAIDNSPPSVYTITEYNDQIRWCSVSKHRTMSLT